MVFCSKTEGASVAPEGKKKLKKSKKKMQDDEIKFSEPGTKEVTVILFGWAGCKDRYLAKYSSFYEQAGYTTIRYTMPIIQVRGYFSYKEYAKKFYDRVFAESSGVPKPRQILWHVFSMNGCSFWTALWSLLHKRKREDIAAISRGVIFDSSPAHVRPHQSARALSLASLPPNDFHAVLRESYRGLLYIYFSSHHALLWLRSQIEDRIWERHSSYWHLQEMEVPKNALFIYSDADEICSSESIEKIIAHFVKRNDDGVHVLKLKDSPHCCHLRTDPEAYTKACLRFACLTDVLTPDDPPPTLDHPDYNVVQA